MDVIAKELALSEATWCYWISVFSIVCLAGLLFGCKSFTWLHTPILHHLFSLSCFPHAIFTFLLLLVGRSWHVGLSGPLVLKYSAIVEGYVGKLFRYVAYVWNNFQQFCFQKYEPHAGKYSRYMLRVFKLNIAEHDGVWHHSFCTCLYRAGTDALFFPQGMNLQRCHPTLHPTLHIPKLHQTTLEIFLGEIPQNGIIPGSLLKLFPTFHFSPYFVHVLFMSFQRTPDGIRWPCVVRGKKGQDALGCHMFCHVFFRGVPDISATFRYP